MQKETLAERIRLEIREGERDLSVIELVIAEEAWDEF